MRKFILILLIVSSNLSALEMKPVKINHPDFEVTKDGEIVEKQKGS